MGLSRTPDVGHCSSIFSWGEFGLRDTPAALAFQAAISVRQG